MSDGTRAQTNSLRNRIRVCALEVAFLAEGHGAHCAVVARCRLAYLVIGSASFFDPAAASASPLAEWVVRQPRQAVRVAVLDPSGAIFLFRTDIRPAGRVPSQTSLPMGKDNHRT
jgi:hypothetical protein